MPNDAPDAETDAGARRLRKQTTRHVMSKTCETCKAKKSRCDSSRPQCDTCRRKGVACVYKERGQPGLRPGYGRAVEGRLSVLEESMAKMSESIQDVLRHVQSRPGNERPMSQPLSQAMEQPQSLPLEHSPQLSVPPVPQYRLPAPLPMISPLAHTGLDPALDPALDPSLPPRHIVDDLVALFFEHVYPWAPLFHQPTFLANLVATPERQLLLHGMVVLGFRFWTKLTPSPAEREHYTKVSRDKLLVETINSTSLVAYQALALLAVDAVGDGPGPRSWNLMAMLVACARQLHFEHNPTPATVEPGVGGDARASSPSSPLVTNDEEGSTNGGPTVSSASAIEAEEKRRLFWTIYSLDRFSSVSHGQPCAIDRRRIRLQYPARDDDWGQSVPLAWFQGGAGSRSPTATLSAFAMAAPLPEGTSLWQCFVDILALMDQLNHLLVQPTNLSLPAQCQEWQSKFRRIEMLRLAWRENLPASVWEPPPHFNAIWHLVHFTYYLVQIRIYMVAAFFTTTSPHMRPSPAARVQLRQTVGTVAGLASGLTAEQVGQLGPMFAFILWVAARCLIIMWTTGHTETTSSATAAPADLTSLLAALHQSALVWPCAACYAEIIQLILDTKNNPGGPTGLDIFNDTRRTVYGLRSRLGTLARHRFAFSTRDNNRDNRELFTSTDDFFDGVFAGLIDMPPAAMTPQQMGFGFGFVNPSPDFDRDWL
ncbi:hypothetical protein SEUCBS139899_008759 [Sporothrix eucalyptigena]